MAWDITCRFQGTEGGREGGRGRPVLLQMAWDIPSGSKVLREGGRGREREREGRERMRERGFDQERRDRMERERGSEGEEEKSVGTDGLVVTKVP